MKRSGQRFGNLIKRRSHQTEIGSMAKKHKSSEKDQDIQFMSHQQLKNEIKKLRTGIRLHRDSKGHRLCWWVPELWGLLPETIEPQPEPPPPLEFIEHCVQYRMSIHPEKWTESDSIGLCELLVRHVEITGSEVFEKCYAQGGEVKAAVFCFVGPYAPDFTAAIRELCQKNGLRKNT